VKVLVPDTIELELPPSEALELSRYRAHTGFADDQLDADVLVVWQN